MTYSVSGLCERGGEISTTVGVVQACKEGVEMGGRPAVSRQRGEKDRLVFQVKDR